MIIAGRFNGPDGSGNGGYSAGLFAQAAAGGNGEGVEVTLRLPPPLDTPLQLHDGRVLTPEGAVVAEVATAPPVDTAVPAVDLATAQAASQGYAGFAGHPFPRCYVCGPQRSDGLGIFPGPVDGQLAAPWLVPDDVSAPTVWASLDCPGGWTAISSEQPYVLGRLAVRTFALPQPGQRCVVVGALGCVQGRKALVHSTLYGPDGEELARARATWIAVSR
jgi:hypothetical protein